MLKNKKKIWNRQNKRLHASFEQLESRQLYSVVTATPQTFQAVNSNSQPGDTIDCAPGNYGTPTFLSSRHYVGAPGADANGGNANGGTGANDQTEITGFTFTGSQLACNATASYNVHNNTFVSIPGGNGIYIGGCHDSSFTFNTFTNLQNCTGIFGYLGSNDTFDNNSFTNVEEPIHVMGNVSNVDVSGNVITGVGRIGIELQEGISNLTVENNYMADWSASNDNTIAISCATGGTGSQDGTVGCGHNITISGNVLLHTSEDGRNVTNFGCPIEIMGTNINITNNTVWGFNGFILNGQWGPSTVSGNKVYDALGTISGGDSVNPAPASINTSDTIHPLSGYTPSSNVPTVSSTRGGALGTSGSTTSVSAPAPTPTPTPTPTQTIPSGITATVGAQSGQVTVTAPAGATLGIYASSLDPSTAVNLGRISGTSATIGGIPLDWEVTVTVTTGGNTYTLPSVQVVNSSIPSSGAFNPALVTALAPVVTTPPPVTTPVVTPTPAPTIPSGISATANGQSGQVTVTAPAGSILSIYASTLDPSTAISLGAISGTSATIGGIPLDWFVTVTVTTGGNAYTLPSVQVLNSSIPSSGAFSPALVVASTPVVTTPPPVTTPVATPTIPSGITAIANGQSGQITVTAPAGSLLGIYASTLSSSSAISLGTMAGTSATIGNIPLNWRVTVTVTTGGTMYTLPSVQVVNSTVSQNGPLSPALVTAAATPVAASGTAAPTNFAATSPTSSEVDLTWTDNTNGQASYVLQRRATHGSSGFQTIATIASGVSSFDDVHVNPNWEYDYRLVAVVSGVASPTVAAHVQVQNTSAAGSPAAVPAPAAPTVLLAGSPNSTEVDLSWVDNTGATATYVLARKQTIGAAGYQVIAVLPTGTTSFKDTEVDADTQYDYFLVAVVPGAASSAATVHAAVQPMLSLSLAAAA